MKETKVYLLDGGTMALDRSYLDLNAGLTGDERFPVYGVLVDHADSKFIFDTGFVLDHICKTVPFTKPEQSTLQTIPGHLDLLKTRPADITHVINSHYHIDYCGGNRQCCMRQRSAISANLKHFVFLSNLNSLVTPIPVSHRIFESSRLRRNWAAVNSISLRLVSRR